LADPDSRFEQAGLSPLCSLPAVTPENMPAGGAGRPRSNAKAALLSRVAEGAPCDDAAPLATLRYQRWCDDYRPDGTFLSRSYFAELAEGGEQTSFENFDEHGAVTEDFTDCDSGHN
jgi:hypothetical protein